MILILEMNQHVVVEYVKYSHQIIRTSEHLKYIAPLLIEEIDRIYEILPTIISKRDKYPYIDGKSLKAVFRRALADAISGEFPIRDFLRYLKRIYITSGLSLDDNEFNQRILDLYQLAKYMEANKDEI